MRQLLISVLIVLLLSAVAVSDGTGPAPLAYIPFENTDGTYGPGTGGNPAWAIF